MILFLASCLTSFAQEKQTRIPSCFYAFDYSPGRETVLCQTGAAEMKEITLSRANIVGPVPALLINGAIQLHTLGEPDEKGVPKKILAATARVPAGIQRALVVLFPNAPDAAIPYRAIAFEHNLRAFPLGTYRVINLSPSPIRGAIGSQVVAVNPGQTADLALRGEPGTVLPVRFEYQSDHAWSRVHRNTRRCSHGPPPAAVRLSGSCDRAIQHAQHPRPQPASRN